jgi:hypothetical protein
LEDGVVAFELDDGDAEFGAAINVEHEVSAAEMGKALAP